MGIGMGPSTLSSAQGWLHSPPCVQFMAAGVKPGGGGMGRGCTTTPEALGMRPPSPPQKTPMAGTVQRAGAAQAVTASLLCWEQREVGFRADLLKLFF